MKKLIFILLLMPSFLRGATYYIDPAGVDDAERNGSISQPWATMNYARTRVITGDVVFANAGTYIINSTVNWPAGVSIDGAGRNLVIFTSTSDPSTMFLLSSTPGTNGNQFIRNISIDGNLITSMGIRIFGRSNVIMHDFTIKNTLRYGLTFADQSGRNEVTTPTHWATGNKAYNFLIQNCGRDHLYYSENGDYYTWQADGGMDISGQNGMEIYDFEIDNQTGGRYAYGLKGLISGGFHKGVKIHDGRIRVNRRDIDGQQSFAFAVELWTVLGGVEVYNLDCNGGIDVSGRGVWDDDNYGYALKVYDNKCVLDQRPTDYPESGLLLEAGGADGIFFTRNWVENFSSGFHMGATDKSLVQGFDSVVVAYNVFANIGYTVSARGGGMTGYDLSGGTTMNRIYYVNNVVHKVDRNGGWGINIEYPTANTWSNTYVRNNIFYNCYTPVQFTNQIIQSLYVDNNLIYGHTRTEIPRLNNSTVIFYTSNDNITDSEPMFVDIGTDYELQSGSPAINAGINVGLDKDFRGWSIVGLPDIGAYEYGATAPAVGGMLIDASGVLLRSDGGTLLKIE